MTKTPAPDAAVSVIQTDRDAAKRTASDNVYMHDDPDFVAAWVAMEEQGYQYGDDALEQVHLGWRLARHRLAALAPAGGERQWPDIGPDPFQGPNDERTVEKAHARLRHAYALQQPIVPSQTALVWRDDIGRVHMRLVQLEALFADRNEPRNDAIRAGLDAAQGELAADVDGRIERLGEKLFALSDRLRCIGAFDSDSVHAAYEAVVAAYQNAAEAAGLYGPQDGAIAAALSTSTAAGEDR